VRRVVPILLALVLAPSIATASWYRCAYDGITRAACCCPSNTHQSKQKTPDPVTTVRATCCCTITQVARTAPPAQAKQPLPLDHHPVALAVALTVAPTRGTNEVVCLARPRAQGDPPDTLFARRCSLLL